MTERDREEMRTMIQQIVTAAITSAMGAMARYFVLKQPEPNQVQSPDEGVNNPEAPRAKRRKKTVL